MTALRPVSSLDVAVLSPHAVVVHGVAAVLASYDRDVAVHDLGTGRSGVRPAWADVVVVDSALLVSGGPSARASVDDGGATVLLVRPEHVGP
ncbi:hypothetical protein QWY28_16040 [Nocardioides sp. SOB77]|uniref:Uncharacterized protein n=1 Tax=Nocardioides oceani TaxID=3058369 RepID=A0ABT8FIE9_9ACTN|nr:hypothetical protein [Nocardioides oceani]MDN4174472.1 hypothetical protein [Nocardioides oceani]